MNKEIPNPPAFPRPVGHITCKNQTGMTLLDYFAGQAIAGKVSGLGYVKAKEVAEEAYELAEAMLAEKARREKEANGI